MSKLAERLAVTAPVATIPRPALPRHIEATSDTSWLLRAVWRALVVLVVTGALWLVSSRLVAAFTRQLAGL